MSGNQSMRQGGTQIGNQCGNRSEKQSGNQNVIQCGKRDLPVTARVKLTLHTGQRFFGPGVCELLERIRGTGSIQAAAADMKMSYSKAWKILNLAEKEMGVSLIIRVTGGRNGGSSVLTEAGEKAVHDFREMEAKVNEDAARLLREYYRSFMPDALMGGTEPAQGTRDGMNREEG